MNPDSGGDDCKRNDILENLRVPRARMESILRQKSCKVWLKERDKNSKYFHMSLMMKQRKNNILTIKDEIRWIQDRRGIRDYFSKKYQELFQSDYPHIPIEVCCYVYEQENRDIICIPTEEEIKECMEKLHPFKSPSPYGFPGFFFIAIGIR